MPRTRGALNAYSVPHATAKLAYRASASSSRPNCWSSWARRSPTEGSGVEQGKELAGQVVDRQAAMLEKLNRLLSCVNFFLDKGLRCWSRWGDVLLSLAPTTTCCRGCGGLWDGSIPPTRQPSSTARSGESVASSWTRTCGRTWSGSRIRWSAWECRGERRRSGDSSRRTRRADLTHSTTLSGNAGHPLAGILDGASSTDFLFPEMETCAWAPLGGATYSRLLRGAR